MGLGLSDYRELERDTTPSTIHRVKVRVRVRLRVRARVRFRHRSLVQGCGLS